MYKKEFEVRWSDVDANAHMANSAYINFMSHCRVSYFDDHGLNIPEMLKVHIGPIIFYEYVHYFKEVYMRDKITVTAELLGLSKDGMFFKIEHNLYNQSGKHLASCEVFGGWIHSTERKLRSLPEPYLSNLENFEKSDRFTFLSKSDLKSFKKRPSDLA